MTGYGSASAQVDGAVVSVEARAVNHRFLDVRVRFPMALAEQSAIADEVARKLLVRGRVELTARVEGPLSGQLVLNRERARAAMRELAELRDELGLSEAIPLSLLGAVPGLFADEARDPSELQKAIDRASRDACQALLEMRRSEGAELARDLFHRVLKLRAGVDLIAARSPELTARYRDKLRARVSALLAGTSAPALDPGRLEQELALIAQRSDVQEELTRLTSHCGQFERLLAPGDEPVGRKLEFLLQEMGREVNTIGSKIDDLELTQCVLELKSELERLREQVQNIL